MFLSRNFHIKARNTDYINQICFLKLKEMKKKKLFQNKLCHFFLCFQKGKEKTVVASFRRMNLILHNDGGHRGDNLL